ncbi:MAG: peptidylprolyl isomerase [Schaedlerella sp.]|nr:peptidylprolyl isomerase [Schaedlerella sp.]
MSNNEVLAKVAGKEITNAEFELYLQKLPQEQRMYAAYPQYREKLLEQLVSMYAYAKMGEDMNLEETEAYKIIMENTRLETLAQLAVNETIKDITVEADEVKAFYDENPQNFKKEETVSAKHILVKEEEECVKVLEEIKNGEKTFEDAAKECSTCPSGQNGGDLGEFGKGQMVKEFEDAAFAAEIGAVVGPVQTQFGYHLIKVENKSEASVIPFEEVEEKITQTLLQQKQNEAYKAKYAEIKAKYVE